jgi:hypothetical protein
LKVSSPFKLDDEQSLSEDEDEDENERFLRKYYKKNLWRWKLEINDNYEFNEFEEDYEALSQ